MSLGPSALRFLGALVVSCGVGLGASAWATFQADSGLLADPRSVAAALGDPPPGARTAVVDLSWVLPPDHARTCCAFGMDLEVAFAGVDVPFFHVGNVMAVDELGAHAFHVAAASPDPEGNGLVYTCRGGWIDVSHVRDSSDVAFFLALHIAPILAEGGRIEIPGHGGTTTVTIAPLPAARISRDGAMTIASALGGWAALRISIWHEVATWYGYEMVPGFSERPSTFSPEDLYSNALGIRLAQAILDDLALETQDDYDLVAQAFIEGTLERLEAQPRETGRAIMASLDGRWWNSTLRLPDNAMVTRRAFPTSEEPSTHRASEDLWPWRAEDAFLPDGAPEVLSLACGGGPAHPLRIASTVGRTAAAAVVSITWAPEAWADRSLPFADPSSRVVDERDFDRLVADVHAALEAELGAGFDQPRPREMDEIEPRE